MTPALDRSVLNLQDLRPLPIALAHRLYSVNTADPQMETLGRLFSALNMFERSMCLAEFMRRLNPVAHDPRPRTAGLRGIVTVVN